MMEVVVGNAPGLMTTRPVIEHLRLHSPVVSIVEIVVLQSWDT